MGFIKDFLARVDRKINRNEYNIVFEPAQKQRVIVEHSRLNNVGDHLGPVIVNWVLAQKGIDPDRLVSKTRHLLAVGSIIGRGRFDCTVWGSGILKEANRERMIMLKRHDHRKIDFRAVRGPLTREIVLSVGYACPPVYGDPAVLMPLIYDPGNPEKEYEVSVILHHRTNRVADNSDDAEKYEISISDELTEKYHLHFIDPKTADYQFFIDELAKSKKVIASSLHGIILAEAYGVPTVFLNWGMDDQPIKFHDWYLSTGREMECSKSMEEALDAAPMPVPDLRAMREALLNSFPYDLWEE